jgi:NADH-quinone oxidoreductase subunit N
MSLYGISGEIFLALGGMVALLSGVFVSKDNSFKITTRICNISFIISFILIFFSHSNSGSLFNEMFVYDGLARYTKSLILVGTILSILISIKPQKIDGFNKPEYPVLILFSVIGMLLMSSSMDLISLYMALELQSLPLYVIAAINRDNLKSSEAGLKYFILGALSSGLLLFGMSLVYGAVGDTSFSSISEFSSQGMTNLLLIGLVFMLAGLAFKISLVPFHMWTPDVYEGAPTPVTAFFAIVPKIAAMTVMIRFTFFAFDSSISSWQQVIVILSLLSMILGSFAAIMQTNLKRLMAYSSIAHMGYALVGIASGILEGISGLLIYMLIYIVMNIGSFIIILSMRRDNQSVEDIYDLKGISKTHPFIAFSFVILMFSMAGIPPLAGFFGKWVVFYSAVNSGLLFLAVIGVLTSVVGAFYYLRIIKIMYFEENEVKLDIIDNKSSMLILSLMMAIIVLFGIFLNWLIEITMGISSLI